MQCGVWVTASAVMEGTAHASRLQNFFPSWFTLQCIACEHQLKTRNRTTSSTRLSIPAYRVHINDPDKVLESNACKRARPLPRAADCRDDHILCGISGSSNKAFHVSEHCATKRLVSRVRTFLPLQNSTCHRWKPEIQVQPSQPANTAGTTVVFESESRISRTLLPIRGRWHPRHRRRSKH